MDIRNFFNAKGQASNAAVRRSAPGASKYGVESKFFGKNGSAEKRKEVAKATTGGLGNDESLEVSTLESTLSTHGASSISQPATLVELWGKRRRQSQSYILGSVSQVMDQLLHYPGVSLIAQDWLCLSFIPTGFGKWQPPATCHTLVANFPKF